MSVTNVSFGYTLSDNELLEVFSYLPLHEKVPLVCKRWAALWREWRTLQSVVQIISAPAVEGELSLNQILSVFSDYPWSKTLLDEPRKKHQKKFIEDVFKIARGALGWIPRVEQRSLNVPLNLCEVLDSPNILKSILEVVQNRKDLYSTLFFPTDKSFFLSDFQEGIRGLVAPNQTLRISGRGIKTIPREILSLVPLKSLDVSGNRIFWLSPRIRQLENLTRLKVSNNLIERLPREIVSLSLLTTLDLSNNLIDELPEDIGRLQLLSTLNVSGNRLSTLPSSIEKLSKLKELDISKNRFSSFPSSFFALRGLTILALGGNGITSIPERIGDLKELESFALPNCPITALPLSLRSLPRLTFLTIDDNQERILAEALQALTRTRGEDFCVKAIAVARVGSAVVRRKW